MNLQYPSSSLTLRCHPWLVLQDAPVANPNSVGCCSYWFVKLGEWIDEIVWRKLYAVIFATSFLLSFSMLRLHRCAPPVTKK